MPIFRKSADEQDRNGKRPAICRDPQPPAKYADQTRRAHPTKKATNTHRCTAVAAQAVGTLACRTFRAPVIARALDVQQEKPEQHHEARHECHDATADRECGCVRQPQPIRKHIEAAATTQANKNRSRSSAM